MNSLRRLLLTLLIALTVIIVALYIAVQTRWGASQLAARISAGQQWHITFDKLSHSWSSPSHLVFSNLSLRKPGQPPLLVAQQVDVGLSARQLTRPGDVNSLQIHNGTLNLPRGGLPSLPLQARRLQLSAMNINATPGQWPLVARQVSGGITPWNPARQQDARFQFSAGQLTLNGLPASQVLMQGETRNGSLIISSLGGDVARGSMSSSLQRTPDGRWQVDYLRISDLRYQSRDTLARLLARAATLPPVTLRNVDITNTQLQGPGWAVNGLSLGLRNIGLEHGSWSAQEGTLSVSASEALYGAVHLFDPIMTARLSGQALTLQQFTTRWAGGLLRATGHWQRQSKALTLDELTIAGLEYTLPTAWKQYLAAPAPGWLNSLQVEKLSASRNLLIDTNPDFPFQFTALDSSGTRLQLVRNNQWGIWGGRLNLNAAAATLNRMDLRRPSMALEANLSTVNISELSAFAGQGLLEATATVSQLPQRRAVLSLSGRAVPLDTLHYWGWPALPLEGDGNLRLNITGSLQHNVPLRPTVSGDLSATNARGLQIHQTMAQGVVTQGNAPGA